MRGKLSVVLWIAFGVVGGMAILGGLFYEYYWGPTRPTGATTGAGTLDVQAPESPVTLVLAAEPGGAGDAGDDYHRAFTLYKQDRAEIDELKNRYLDMVRKRFVPTPADLKLLQPVADALAAGAAKKDMTYCFRLGPKRIQVPYIPPESGMFQDTCDVQKFLATYHVSQGEEHYPQAEKLLRERFTAGWHLMRERARLGIVRRGFGLQRDSCALLRQLYQRWGKADRDREVRRYVDELDVAAKVYRDLEYVVLWHNPPHPGDVFNLAENHADPAVRRHATVVLGVVKLTCTRYGDKRYVAKLIDEKLRSPDAIESEAARCAKAFDQAALNKLKRLESP